MTTYGVTAADTAVAVFACIRKVAATTIPGPLRMQPLPEVVHASDGCQRLQGACHGTDEAVCVEPGSQLADCSPPAHEQ